MKLGAAIIADEISNSNQNALSLLSKQSSFTDAQKYRNPPTKKMKETVIVKTEKAQNKNVYIE